MIALLVWQSVHSGVDLGWKITSGCIFGFTFILLYAISSAYHAVTYKPAKDVLNILDHMAIYFLIAGTYTPFCLVTLRANGHAALGWTIFGIEWFAVLVGVLVKVWNTGKRQYLSTAAYIAMGWVCIFVVKSLWESLPLAAFLWLLAGGMFYTTGGVIYALKCPIFNNRHKLFGSHEIFHVFVMAGSICHFIFMYQYVL